MSFINSNLELVEYSLRLGEAVLQNRTKEERKEQGQYLTPQPTARFMASQLGAIPNGARILDPAIGSGTLACAVIEQALHEPSVSELWIEGYETDPDLLDAARACLQHAIGYAAEGGLKVHVHLHETDFVQAAMPLSRHAHLYHGTLLDTGEPHLYDLIIANPPYFKLKSTDPRVKHLRGYGNGHTNIYTVFMALCSRMLSETGRACFIVPRSFCSGTYFSTFRRKFFKQIVFEAFHLFQSREATFKNDGILQENVIISFRTRNVDEDPDRIPTSIRISVSQSGDDLRVVPITRMINRKYFLGSDRGTSYFRLPAGELDEHILETMDGWQGTLKHYGLKVSTGPVVSFRARSMLRHDTDLVSAGRAAPLLWMNNITPQHIIWPIDNGKHQAISLDANSSNLLVPTSNYVLLRRFSAKEEPRRLIAAPLLAANYGTLCSEIGLENHLNYVYRPDGELENLEALGLSALFNSALVDRYVRITNGNTQVNATELRVLPLPPLNIIKDIGAAVVKLSDQDDIDFIVFSTLHDQGYLPAEIPLFRETRFAMGKLQEAQQILQDLGLPPAQQNEISALTLLVLAQLSEDTDWSEARPKSLRIHDMLREIAERYGREYAENTRETIRRQVIHQFEQAGLVRRNPDEPDLPTNSPRTHYAISDLALQTIRRYGTTDWASAALTFQDKKGGLLEIYRRERESHMIPLRLSSGEEYHLSPGKHNALQAAIVEEFGPRFAPGAQVLYLGDTANKTLILDEAGFEKLKVPLVSHDKLPDIVLYDDEKGWLFLIEAVTSHGPVSPKRQVELEEMFSKCSADRVYVSAFPDFATFKAFLADIAWETEVWLAETPDHMIHYNGDRFLKPRS